jgi:hypothetical protein
LSPANPIYDDAIVRTLTYTIQFKISELYIKHCLDGKNIDMNGLLKAFQEFLPNNPKLFTAYPYYQEAAPHLILQAFLQRVANGEAQIIPEYATSRKRVELAGNMLRKTTQLKLNCLKLSLKRTD